MNANLNSRDAATCDDSVRACRWIVTGRVQGVGFRPFIFRLAQKWRIHGFVQNCCGDVSIVAEAMSRDLLQFGRALLSDAPPLARPRIASCIEALPTGYADFRIVTSDTGNAGQIHLPPDYFCCDACLRELNDVRDRRYGHPFINCTQCGPRYTLIRRLPYDRINTSMADFQMCDRCRAEYEDPANRRFHAEPIACPACGPQLYFRVSGGRTIHGNSAALEACAARLLEGGIVAVKGIGGYHLMTDATNADAVALLRARKHRPHKPFALMLPPEPALLDRWLELDNVSRAALFDPARPIVLVRPRQNAMISAGVHPGLREVGAMLPYSAMHHLLMKKLRRPLVATSANLGGEPVLTEADEVESRLAEVADCYLHHDRRIVRPADDSVVRVIAGKARPIRLGRGVAPIEMSLPFALKKPMLAVGGQMKNTIALGWGERAVISPHVGDMDSPRALDVFEQVIADVQSLYGVVPQLVACDANPDFAATRWAGSSSLPTIRVLHHHAHASALAAEHVDVASWLIFTWDGIGLGDDNTLWGGEGFIGGPGQWRRVTTLRAFQLPGVIHAARAPWRSAAALCWEAGVAWRGEQYSMALQAWHKGLGCRATSAAGRLFDGAAALVGLLEEASFEGQGPMWLEALTEGEEGQSISLPVAKNAAGLWEMDWRPLIAPLLDTHQTVAMRSANFHDSLSHGLLTQARAVRAEFGIHHVGLAGGVFQNRRLTERALALMHADGFDVRLAEQLPCNDAALSFGQMIEAGARQ